MPGRKIVLASGQYYHIFNRTISNESAFVQVNDCKRALLIIDYYRFYNPPIKLSHLMVLNEDTRQKIMERKRKESEKLVDIVCFCLMFNHFHLILKQVKDGGISQFLSLFQNSFTRYFNTKHDRHGHLFQGQFKAVRIVNEEYLLHLSRYIHLNPYSSYVVKDKKSLLNYPWSSLHEYLTNTKGVCDKDIILSGFSKKNNYREFVFDRADYQKQLEEIKYLVME